MGWIKRVFKKIFYKEPNGTPKTDPVIIPNIPGGKFKFDFTKWDGVFCDLSHWETAFNINEYKCPVLLNKCTDGINFLDNTHKPRQTSCKMKGILYGGYHFYEVGYGPVAQAEFYVKSHGEFTINPICDYETNGSQSESDLKKDKEDLLKFLVHVELLTGRIPIIYTGLSLCKFLEFDERFIKYPLWIAAYRNISIPPLCPKPWKQYFAWQYSESAKIDGCGPSSDGNLYNKDMDLFNLKEFKSGNL